MGTLRFGRFHLLQMLGYGGMGIVYAAYDEVLDRQIALKVIRRDVGELDSVRQRTLREAQGLARLSHPNVVQVYEVGEVAGQVFIAMEYLQGRTLSQWLDVRKRDWQAVLAVFVQAGRGLAAAHAAKLIHRDFKPDNVIVTDEERVCVVDFGLVVGHRGFSDDVYATSPSSSLTDLVITQPGARVGTPAYMSPEQHRLLPIDARSDQFSFCVALWEALYGSRPFAGATREELIASIESGVQIPTSTSPVPTRVRAAILRGLARAAHERHPSMEALLAQLSRSQRRPWAVLGTSVGALVVASLGLGYWSASATPCAPGDLSSEWNPLRRAALVATLSGSEVPHAPETSQRAVEALDRYAAEWSNQSLAACEAHHQGLQSDRLFALWTLCLERRRSELSALLQTLGPGDIAEALQVVSSMPSPERCAAAATQDAAQEQTRAIVDPEIARAVESGTADLELARQAERLRRVDDLERLLESLVRSPAVQHAPFAATVHWLHSRLDDMRGRYAESERQARLAWLAGLRGGDLEVAGQAAVARARVQSLRLAHFEAAEESLAEAEALFETLPGDPERAGTLAAARGLLADARGDQATAEAWFRQALTASEEVHGADDPRTGVAANNLAGALRQQNRIDEALALYNRALTIAEATYGPRHPMLAASLSNLGNLFYDLQRYSAAQSYYERALALREAALGPDHPEVADSLNNLGNNLLDMERPAEAYERHARALAIRERSFGPRHPVVARSLANGAAAAAALGHTSEALASLQRALQIQRDALGPEHPDLASTHNALGNLHFANADYAAAVAEYERAVALYERLLAPDASELAMWLFNLGNTQLALGRHDVARTTLSRALELAEGAQASTRQRLMPLVALARLGLAGDDVRALYAAVRRALAAEDATLLPEERAELRFLAARTAWASGGDARSQAEAFAREALGLLRDEAVAPELAADVEAWLQRPRQRSAGSAKVPP